MQDILNFIVNMSWVELLVALQGVLLALIVFLKYIPGNQGEEVLQKIADFVSKFIKK